MATIDCRSCRHRNAWKQPERPTGPTVKNSSYWECGAMRRGAMRPLTGGVFKPACGGKEYRLSLWKWVAYKLYCKIVFDEELTRRTLRRLEGRDDVEYLRLQSSMLCGRCLTPTRTFAVTGKKPYRSWICMRCAQAGHFD